MSEHKKPPTQRQLRVGELIRHALADIFLKETFYDPLLRDARLTVSEVRVSGDLHNATAFVCSLGATVDSAKCIKALQAVGPFLRKEVAKRVILRFMPLITFRYDDSFDKADRIEKLLYQSKASETLTKSEEE